eukprot:g991.t1
MARGAGATAGGVRVVLTDLEHVLPSLRRCVGANAAMLQQQRAHAHVAVAPLAWGGPPAALDAAIAELGGAPDLVVGSDLVYRQDVYPLLAATVAQLCERGAVVVLAQQRRFKHESRFWSALGKHGALRARKVWEYVEKRAGRRTVQRVYCVSPVSRAIEVSVE